MRLISCVVYLAIADEQLDQQRRTRLMEPMKYRVLALFQL